MIGSSSTSHSTSSSGQATTATSNTLQAGESADEVGIRANSHDHPSHHNEEKQPDALVFIRSRVDPAAGAPTRSASLPDLRPIDSGHESQVTSHALSGHNLLKRNNSTAAALSSAAAGPNFNAPRPALLSKKLLEPTVPVGKPPGWRSSLKATMKYSWLNVLLIAVPVAWAMDFSHQSSTVIFVTSFIAIIPLAALLGFATEELALRVGDAFGGLLNATFGNAVELIISILALVKGELRIVQSSMLGSILSNCLLVLGMCYFAGGLRFHEQGYGIRAAQVNINLLAISIVAIVIPVAYHTFTAEIQSVVTTDQDVLGLSRGIAIILLVVYGAYLTFQLWTHAYLYLPPSLESGQVRAPTLAFIEGPQPPTARVFRIPSLPSWGGSSSSNSSRAPSIASDAAEDVEQGETEEEKQRKKEVEHNTPKLSVWFSLGLLVVVTVLTGVTAEFLISSIDGLTQTGAVSREFVALILLPLVGNAAEHVTAVTVATKNKLDLSMAVAVGSSIQISLFVIPFLILLGWCIGQPLTLFFDPFEVLVLFVSIVAVNWAISDGRTNWLEGFCLMIMYVIIAVTFFYYPGLPN